MYLILHNTTLSFLALVILSFSLPPELSLSFAD